MRNLKLLPYSPKAIVCYLKDCQKFAIKRKHYPLARQIEDMLQSEDYTSCYISLNLVKTHTPDLVCAYNNFYIKIHLNPN